MLACPSERPDCMHGGHRDESLEGTPLSTLDEFRRVSLDDALESVFFHCMSSVMLLAELEGVPEETRREVLNFLAFLKSRNAASLPRGESLLPLAQTAWAEDWSSPEEDEAWKDL